MCGGLKVVLDSTHVEGHLFLFQTLFLSLPQSYRGMQARLFQFLLEKGQRIDVDCARVRRALIWLKRNNLLYKDVQIDEIAMKDAEELQDMSCPPPTW